MSKEVMEKYFIGFDFTDKARPTLLVGEHNDEKKCVLATNFIVNKELVEELYVKLTKKEIK